MYIVYTYITARGGGGGGGVFYLKIA